MTRSKPSGKRLPVPDRHRRKRPPLGQWVMVLHLNVGPDQAVIQSFFQSVGRNMPGSQVTIGLASH